MKSDTGRAPLRRSFAAILTLILLGSLVSGLSWPRVATMALASGLRPPRVLPNQEATPMIDPSQLTLTPQATSPLPTPELPAEPTPTPTLTPTPTIDPTAIEIRRARVIAPSGANLRAAANINSGILTVLPNEAVYVIYQGPLTGGDAAQWVELALPGGTRGWIKADLVAIDAVRLPYGDAAALLETVGMMVPEPGAIPVAPTLAPGLLPTDTTGIETPLPPVAESTPAPPPLPGTVTGLEEDTLASLTLEQLRAAAWVVPSINVTGTIQFVEGVFANETTGLNIALTDRLVAVGDLTGDGANDAAVVLQVTQPDGTTSHDLVVAVNQGQVPVSLAGVQLGAPVDVEELRIDKGAIWIAMRIVGPGDDPCCPTLPLKRIYILRGDALVDLPASAYGQIFPYRYGAQYGYVNVLGEFVVPPIYQFADDFSEGLALVSRDGTRFGFINALGKVVIPLAYTFATPFSAGVTVAGLPSAEAGGSERVVYLDRSGRNIFGETTFAAGQPFRDGLAAVKADDGKFGYINTSGEAVIPAAYDFALTFSEGLAAVLQDDRVGYINRSGTMVIPVQFDSGSAFSEGLAAVAISGTVGYIDHRGEFAIQPVFDRASSFVDGLAAVIEQGKERYINSAGATAIAEPAFTSAQDFSEGLAAVRVGERFGYVNTRGELIIEPQFAVANPFREGFAVVETERSWGVIAHDGTWLVQLTLQPLTPLTASVGVTGTVQVTLEAPSGPATQIVPFIPNIPDEIRQGGCYSLSNIVDADSAWRCGLVGGDVFDPCVLGVDGTTVVCAADPVEGDENAFALELTQGLPPEQLNTREYPGAWIFELAGGTICRYVLGTAVTIEGEEVIYTCSDRTQVLGEIDKSASLWTIDVITTESTAATEGSAEGTTESGLRVGTRTPTPVLRSWLPARAGAPASGG